eukprot:gene24430-biopygen13445
MFLERLSSDLSIVQRITPLGETAMPASGPCPVRVRSFKCYRAPRVRSASGPRPLLFFPGPPLGPPGTPRKSGPPPRHERHEYGGSTQISENSYTSRATPLPGPGPRPGPPRTGRRGCSRARAGPPVGRPRPREKPLPGSAGGVACAQRHPPPRSRTGVQPSPHRKARARERAGGHGVCSQGQPQQSTSKQLMAAFWRDTLV